MGKNYYQLNFDERIELDRLRDAGCSKREISRIMGRSHTTISRELRRVNGQQQVNHEGRWYKVVHFGCEFSEPLIAFKGQHIIGTLVADFLGNLTLTPHRIQRHYRPFKAEQI